MLNLNFFGGTAQVYNPLVVNAPAAGAAPNAVPPVQFTLPPNAVVGIWIVSNAFKIKGSLTLIADVATQQSLAQGKCVHGNGPINPMNNPDFNRDRFGLFAYCNAPAFYAAVNAAMTDGGAPISQVSPPPADWTPGKQMANDGMACPNTRDFFSLSAIAALAPVPDPANPPAMKVARNVAPQHRVATTYLVKTADKMIAQDTTANRVLFGGAAAFTVLSNGDTMPAIAMALGCQTLRAHSLTDPTVIGNNANALALYELYAAAIQVLAGQRCNHSSMCNNHHSFLPTREFLSSISDILPSFKILFSK
jgi:hypothetical protein